MSSTNFASNQFKQDPQKSHSHNLSINSASSLTEPTTPPTVSSSSKSLWDAGKLNGTLVLPSFSLDSHIVLDSSHSRKFSADSSGSDKENHGTSNPLRATPRSNIKIDKDYLSSICKEPLASLRNDILRLAKDQHGCRFLQKRIDENFVSSYQARHANFEIIFAEVQTSLYELIIDPFGNYLIQKLIMYCSETDLNSCLECLNSNFFSISINQHGTRALQKLIEKISTEYQLSLLVKGLKPYIIELIKDLNGNHVIQKILNKYSPEECQFIYDAIVKDLLVVATHKHGCCVLQKCLNHVNPSQHMAFSNVILDYDNFVRLVNDQFGNYVLQYLISINSIDVNCKLYENFLAYGILDLCVFKFSSNVVEKLLKNCYDNEIRSIGFSNLKFTMIVAILNTDLNKLVNDPYGNYVVQTLIDILINPQGTYFIQHLSGERMLLPTLSVLLGENFQVSVDSLQVQIIKLWFINCKIVSTFGKRIQCKINNILNGGSRAFQKKTSNDPVTYRPSDSVQNMNSNGEFVKSVSPLSANYQHNRIRQAAGKQSMPSFLYNNTSGRFGAFPPKANTQTDHQHPANYHNSPTQANHQHPQYQYRHQMGPHIYQSPHYVTRGQSEEPFQNISTNQFPNKSIHYNSRGLPAPHDVALTNEKSFSEYRRGSKFRNTSHLDMNREISNHFNSMSLNDNQVVATQPTTFQQSSQNRGYPEFERGFQGSTFFQAPTHNSAGSHH